MRLSLALAVFGILTNYPDDAATVNNLALHTDFFD
jgi:hypothetical protein